MKCLNVINNNNKKESAVFTWQSVLLEPLEPLSNGMVLITHSFCEGSVCFVAFAASVCKGLC